MRWIIACIVILSISFSGVYYDNTLLLCNEIIGQRGDNGTQGLQGDKGETGPPGDAGLPGETGDMGDAGEPGEPGPSGFGGPTGPEGVSGAVGVSGSVRVQVYAQTSAGDGGTVTQNTWNHRFLNDDFGGNMNGTEVSLNSGSVQVNVAGIYRIHATAISVLTGVSQLRIQDITNSVTLLHGLTGVAYGDTTLLLSVAGYISIQSPVTLQLQHNCQTTRTTDGQGAAIIGFSTTMNVYAIFSIFSVY